PDTGRRRRPGVPTPPAAALPHYMSVVAVPLAITAIAVLQRELLDAPAANRLAHVQIAFRVDGHHVQEREVAGHVPGPAEAVEERTRRSGEGGRMIESPQDLVAAVGHVHEGLPRLCREIDVPRRTSRP